MNLTTDPSFWPDSNSWPAVAPTSDQPGTYREQQWTIHVYRFAEDLPPGDRWGWSRYRCLPHCQDRPGSVIEEDK